MTLIFDCESTGKINYKAPDASPLQPRIVQLAALLMDNDGREVDSMNVIITPQGQWAIPDEAAAIHGITTERAEVEGIPIKEALQRFAHLKAAADTVVAHNMDFDRFLLLSEIHRCWGAWIESALPMAKGFCTMRWTMDMLKLPGFYGQYKFPKLAESYHFLFGEDVVGAHDALNDCAATARIYFELMRRSSFEPLRETMC